MITKSQIEEIVKRHIRDTDWFVVDLFIKQDNSIYLFIDKPGGITLDECVHLSRAIEKELNRDKEDFELNISSPGLDMPLRVPLQYSNHIGHKIKIEKKDGTQLRGKILAFENLTLTLETEEKAKKKKMQPVKTEIHYNDIKQAKLIIEFK